MHVSTCFRWQAHTGMHKHAICKSICFKEAKRRNVVEIEVTQLNFKKNTLFNSCAERQRGGKFVIFIATVLVKSILYLSVGAESNNVIINAYVSF